MPYNGNGTFNRVYDWQTDKINGVKIRADRMDTEMNGMATGLSTCVTRDGQSPATANLPMGGFNHTGVSDGTARNHYASVGQVQDGYKTTFDHGYLVPFLVDEVLPGDTFNVDVTAFARLSTPLAIVTGKH